MHSLTEPIIDTHQHGFALDLDPARYGTFAEIRSRREFGHLPETELQRAR